MKFDVFDEIMPSVIRREYPVRSVTFKEPGDVFETSTAKIKQDALLWELERNIPPVRIDKFIYEDVTQDRLKGYGIGNDGNLYNEYGYFIVDGYNHIKKCDGDVIR